MGIRYKKSTESNWTDVTYTGGISSADGTYSITLTNLSPSTTYDVEAHMSVHNGTTYTEITKTGQFTTSASSSYVPAGWLELPEVTGSEDLVVTMYKTGGTTGTEANRNYTMNYSKDRYAALWVAYTLTEQDVVANNGGSSTTWNYNNAVFDGGYQVNVKDNSYGTNYGNDLYSRGHQIPNADRTTSSTAKAQTYLLTNQTPQIQNKFNGSIWGSLEKAARGFVVTSSYSSNDSYNASFTKTDVLYVITGPCYGKYGTSETPTVTLTAAKSGVTPTTVDVPRYYWKVFLKVKWDGDSISDAKAIGFWFVHQEYSNNTYTNYVQSVNQIESWTGFNLFANLPDAIEESVEANTSWEDFRDF